MARMLQGLRRIFGAPVRHLADLEQRVAQLERERLEREMEVADLKDFLTRHYKRVRQRERRDTASSDDLDPITRAILARRGALPTNNEGD